jgi:hypothetical protein
MLNFSDYAVVVQAALLGQGIAFGWITVASHALITGALVPASEMLTRTSRRCLLISPSNHMSKDRVEVITSVERRRRRIRHSIRSLDSLPLLRPLELRQAA